MVSEIDSINQNTLSIETTVVSMKYPYIEDDFGYADQGPEASTVIVNCSPTDAVYSNISDPYPDFTQIFAVRLSFVVTYLIVMVMAVVGNAVVCFIVFCNRKMHTAVNYYIVNLAVCDFMVGIFVLPVKLLELAAPASWRILNDGLCTSLMYSQTIIVFASVLTLVAICIERYLAIVLPLESRKQQSKRRAKRILFVTWLVPCFVASPFLYPSEAYENKLPSHYGTIIRLTCFTTLPEMFRKGYYTFLFFFIYLIPLVFIAATCFKVAKVLLKDIPIQRQGSLRRQEANRRRVAKMVLMVVFAFAIAWTPYFLVSIITQYQKVNFMEKQNFFFTMLCINLFAFTNSCVNPLIYCAMSSRFRGGFIRFFRFISCAWAFSGPEETAREGSLNTRPDQVVRSRRYPCKVPMCLVTQSSSERGSGGPSDSAQTAMETRNVSLLSSASKKLKTKVIVHYMGKSIGNISSGNSGNKPTIFTKGVTDCKIQEWKATLHSERAIPPVKMKCREFRASANDVSKLLEETSSVDSANRGSVFRKCHSYSAIDEKDHGAILCTANH